MLVRRREGQGFDAQRLGHTKQAVEVEAEGVGGQLRVEPGAQAPKALGMVHLNAELLSQLAIDRLRNLAGPVQRPPDRLRHLALLGAPG